VAKPLLSHSD